MTILFIYLILSISYKIFLFWFRISFQKQEMADFLLSRLSVKPSLAILSQILLSNSSAVIYIPPSLCRTILNFDLFKVCTAIVPFSRILHSLVNLPFTLLLSILPVFIFPILEKSPCHSAMLLLIQLSYLEFPFVHFSSFFFPITFLCSNKKTSITQLISSSIRLCISSSSLPTLMLTNFLFWAFRIKNSYFSVFPSICLIFLRTNFPSSEPLSNTSPHMSIYLSQPQPYHSYFFLLLSPQSYPICYLLSLTQLSSQPNN